MSWHKITISGKEVNVNPISVKRNDSGYSIIGMVKSDTGYKRITIDCTKITHVDGFEVFATYLVRPLSNKLGNFNEQSLRIVLDHNDQILSLGVIKPQ